MRRRLTIGVLRVLGAAAVALLAVEPALACPVCFGAGDSPMATGVNNGILVLLGVVGAVQIGFVAMFVSIRRRTRDYKDRKDSFSVINGGVE